MKYFEIDLEINYLNQFQSTSKQILSALPYRGQQSSQFFSENSKEAIRTQIIKFEANLNKVLKTFSFDLNIFLKLGFYGDNIVAIGANGSGKTSLSNKLKSHLGDNGVVISAQRILLVPVINAINNPEKTASELKQAQMRDKTNKNPNEISYLQNEFAIVLKNLLAESIALGTQYRTFALEAQKQGKDIPEPPKSNLDRTLEIWNSLIEHRILVCRDGMNLSLEPDHGDSYSASQMSDGEKVLLFLIAQVLQAPENGFIIADEPEMYLHKTILKKLWDMLERERQDCIFIYLTHDLDFATSRIDSKKIWIKSYTHPDFWEIENIPENLIPESLILELIGSRKNILFCEGVKNSLDEKIYTILFPHLTITPVGSCLDVINYTKAFNRMDNIHTVAMGIIDSDHHAAERLEALIDDKVYSFSLAEIENLLLDEEFLHRFSEVTLAEEGSVYNIKSDILTELSSCKIVQAANYVSAKVDYYFTDSNIVKGDSIENLKANLNSFNEKIDLEGWYAYRLSEIDGIVSSSNYDRAIRVFNNKGIKRFVNSRFKIKDFTEKAIRFLQQDEDNNYLITKYFPSELWDHA